MKTTDGGESWITNEIDLLDFETECVYLIDEQVGFVGGDGDDSGLYKTINGGNTWYIPDCIYPINYIRQIAFSNDSMGFAITSEAGFIIGWNKIYKTINGGANWYEVLSGVDGYASFNDIDFPTDDIGYITLADNEITAIKTTDGGETWFPIDFPCTATPTSVSFFSEDEGLIMGNGGIIFKTYTGGIVNVPEITNDNRSELQLHCFPNPVVDILNIELGREAEDYPDEIIFYDNIGRVVEKIRNSEKQKIIKLNVSNWNNGIYIFISLSNNKTTGKGKFEKVN